MEDAAQAGEGAFQYLYFVTGLVGAGVVAAQAGAGVFLLFQVVDDGIRHRAQQVAEAHQACHAEGGAHGGQALLIGIHLDEQVAGEQGLHHFGPLAAAALAQAYPRQVGGVALALQLQLRLLFLARLAVHGVPAQHDTPACCANCPATIAAGLCSSSLFARSSP